MLKTRVLILSGSDTAGLGCSYVRAFEALGVQVQHYDIRTSYYETLPGLRNGIVHRLLSPVAARLLNKRMRRDLRGARSDLVLVMKGRHISGKTVRWLKRQTAAPVVNFCPDDPFTSVQANRLTFGTEVLAAYSACFTFAKHLIPQYHECAVEHAHYLPFARDPWLHSPPALSTQRPTRKYDLVFVGNLDPERIDWLESLTRFRLAIFGGRTWAALPGSSRLRRAALFPEVYGGDFVRAVHTGAISLNLLRKQNQSSHNMRSYESLAAGAFTLSQRTPELLELFEEDREVAFFGSKRELIDKVMYWLKQPDQRARIARAGFDRVENDTYARRAQSILKTVRDLNVRD